MHGTAGDEKSSESGNDSSLEVFSQEDSDPEMDTTSPAGNTETQLSVGGAAASRKSWPSSSDSDNADHDIEFIASTTPAGDRQGDSDEGETSCTVYALGQPRQSLMIKEEVDSDAAKNTVSEVSFPPTLSS